MKLLEPLYALSNEFDEFQRVNWVRSLSVTAAEPYWHRYGAFRPGVNERFALAGHGFRSRPNKKGTGRPCPFQLSGNDAAAP